MAQDFRFGLFAGGDPQQRFKNFCADLLDRGKSVDNGSGVDVHVVRHAQYEFVLDLKVIAA